MTQDTRRRVVNVEPKAAIRRSGTVNAFVLTLDCGHTQEQRNKPTRALAAGETTITCKACQALALWKPDATTP